MRHSMPTRPESDPHSFRYVSRFFTIFCQLKKVYWFFYRFFLLIVFELYFFKKIKKRPDLKIWKYPQKYYNRWKNFWASGGSGKIIFTIFFKYFLLTIIYKFIKDFLITYDNNYIKDFIIFKTPEAKFEGVLIEWKGGAGWSLVQEGQSAKIWLTAINAWRRPRQERTFWPFRGFSAITILNLDSYLPRFVIGDFVNPRLPKFTRINTIFVFWFAIIDLRAAFPYTERYSDCRTSAKSDIFSQTLI